MSDQDDVEKGFNDSELADIMSEIESLEEEFGDDVEASESPAGQTESIEAESVEDDSPKEEVTAAADEEVEPEAVVEEVEAKVEEEEEDVVEQSI